MKDDVGQEEAQDAAADAEDERPQRVAEDERHDESQRGQDEQPEHLERRNSVGVPAHRVASQVKLAA